MQFLREEYGEVIVVCLWIGVPRFGMSCIGNAFVGNKVRVGTCKVIAHRDWYCCIVRTLKEERW